MQTCNTNRVRPLCPLKQLTEDHSSTSFSLMLLRLAPDQLFTAVVAAEHRGAICREFRWIIRSYLSSCGRLSLLCSSSAWGKQHHEAQVRETPTATHTYCWCNSYALIASLNTTRLFTSINITKELDIMHVSLLYIKLYI